MLFLLEAQFICAKFPSGEFCWAIGTIKSLNFVTHTGVFRRDHGAPPPPTVDDIGDKDESLVRRMASITILRRDPVEVIGDRGDATLSRLGRRMGISKNATGLDDGGRPESDPLECDAVKWLEYDVDDMLLADLGV